MVPRRSISLSIAAAIIILTLAYILPLTLAITGVFYITKLAFAHTGVFTALLLVGAFAGAGRVAWCLFCPEDPFETPGPRLHPNQEPRLFAEISRIAKDLGLPEPTEVYVHPEAIIAVEQHGGFLGFRSRRIVSIGLPLLGLLTLPELRYELAFQYIRHYGLQTPLSAGIYRILLSIERRLQTLESTSLAAPSDAVRPLPLADVLFAFSALLLYLCWKVTVYVVPFLIGRHCIPTHQLASSLDGPISNSGTFAVLMAGQHLSDYYASTAGPVLHACFCPPLAEGFARLLNPYLPDYAQRDDPTPKLMHIMDNLQQIEMEIVPFLLITSLRDTVLTPISWDETPEKAYLPIWRRAVARNRDLLQGATLGDAVELVPRIHRTGRVDNAQRFVVQAIAVALTRQGWTLRTPPGTILLEWEFQQFHPEVALEDFFCGCDESADWREYAGNLGISHVPLSPS